MKIYKYVFSYTLKTQNPNFKAIEYKEYTGTVINAPDEDDAWRAFLGISGEYGMPKADNYSIDNIGIAYEFDGNAEEWLLAVKLGKVE